jgi:hypothetical protein
VLFFVLRKRSRRNTHASQSGATAPPSCEDTRLVIDDDI